MQTFKQTISELIHILLYGFLIYGIIFWQDHNYVKNGVMALEWWYWIGITILSFLWLNFAISFGKLSTSWTDFKALDHPESKDYIAQKKSYDEVTDLQSKADKWNCKRTFTWTVLLILKICLITMVQLTYGNISFVLAAALSSLNREALSGGYKVITTLCEEMNLYFLNSKIPT